MLVGQATFAKFHASLTLLLNYHRFLALISFLIISFVCPNQVRHSDFQYISFPLVVPFTSIISFLIEVYVFLLSLFLLAVCSPLPVVTAHSCAVYRSFGSIIQQLLQKWFSPTMKPSQALPNGKMLAIQNDGSYKQDGGYVRMEFPKLNVLEKETLMA